MGGLCEGVPKEKRILIGMVGATIFGAFLMMISVATDHWVELIIPGGYYRNSSKGFVTEHHSGLWRICRTEVRNHTIPHVKSK